MNGAGSMSAEALAHSTTLTVEARTIAKKKRTSIVC